MPVPHFVVEGVSVPALIYGTAWKEERTKALVLQALEAGFRGIDTANQRRHYFEAAVGEAVQEAVREGRVTRDAVFLQTKFTYVTSQDHRLPYDPRAAPAKQVEQSIESSLAHLGVEQLDAYLLHGPSVRHGVSDLDWQTWRAMEDAQRAGKTRLLGVSNVTAAQLAELWEKASVRPKLVQNRTFVWPQADGAVRRFCREHGLAYEGFSLLTAIPRVVQDPRVREVARRVGKTPEQVVLRHCLEAGMVLLTGTTSRRHMEEDLAIVDFELSAEDAALLRALTGGPQDLSPNR
ncbi:MAG TPA: aldo/keto reductase [Candidatus Thermoplasmatota archaeon]|nr:aldo/keto reductase [Candidatus Thermoplasmatota archaeon]